MDVDQQADGPAATTGTVDQAELQKCSDLHVHTTAAPHVDVFLELTYEKETYYNEREGLFKVYNEHHLKEDGFVACTEMRAFYADPKDYDENLKMQIMLTSAEQAGLESHDRSIKNIYDAVLLKSKRIGHGFQLSLFPNLLQEVIKRDICVEACPLSNMVLGYTLDLRNHPVRYMMHQGLQVSISSDDPGFFHYSGVTLDFIYVTLAWELDIWDLKKLCINGIKYSSIEEEKKQNLLENVFPADWAAFVAKLSNLEVQEAVTEVAPQ